MQWGAPDRDRLAAARRLGLDRLELDVAACSGGEPVVLHDLDPEPGVRVEAQTLASLRARLPSLLTLDEAVEILAPQPLLLDLKGAVAQPLGRWLAARPHLRDAVAVCTDDLASLLVLRHEAPAVERWRTLPMVGTGRGEGRRRALAVAGRARLPRRLPLLVREVAAAGLSCDHLVVTPKLCAAAHRLGLPVAAWTVNRASTARRLAEAGVDLVTTDEPESMRRALLHL